jgi:serine/threonine-protein kinase
VDPEALERHFQELAGQPPAQRLTALKALADGDPDLARRLAALLDAHDRDDTIGLDALAREAARHLGAFDPSRLIGRTLGGFRLTGLIGRGGMGLVFSAERDQQGIRQDAAIKLLSAPIFDPATGVRFVREASALARLDHPDICRLRDWGRTEEGWPYLILDYVRGVPIHAYAQTLPTARRLALVARVCQAVAAAHRQLIVHLDIKPDNILVGADDHPVLLDFGVARVLSDEAGAADTLTRWMTPDYASPEQLRGERAAVPADIYALGSLLYEVATGERPFSMSALSITDALAQIERGASLPSRRRPGLSRDLDAVCARAMHPDPTRRYPSADALAEDILALLAARPVKARADTVGYRISKLLQRHPVSVPLGLTGLLAIITLAGLLAAQAADLRMQRDRAEREAVRARSATQLLLGSIDAANPTGDNGGDLKLSELLEITSSRIDRELASSPQLRAEALLQLGDVRRSLGQHALALPLYDQALALLDAVPEAESADTRLSVVLGRADALHRLDRLDEAMETAQAALAEANPDNRWRALLISGGLHTIRGEHDQGEADLLRALAEIPDDQPTVRAEAMNDLGSLFSERGRHAEALDWYQNAVEEVSDLPNERELLALLHTNLANDLSQLGRVDEAAVYIQQALDTRLALYGERHYRTIETLMYQAGVRTEQGRWDEAADIARRALALEEDLFGPDSIRAGHIWTQLGTAMDRSRRFDESSLAHSRALDILLAHLPADHVALGMARNNLASALVAGERYQESIAHFEQAYAIFERAANGEPTIYLAIIAANLGISHARVGAQPNGLEWATRGLTIIEGLLPREHFVHAHIRNGYAENLLATGNLAEAEAQARAAEAAFAASSSPVSPKSLDANFRVLASIYEQIGRTDLVQIYRGKLEALESSR